MDKQEYREFLDEIRKGYNAKNYEQVAAYADELDFGKIKEPRILEIISDSYDHLGETDNAIDALEAAFGRNKTSKQAAEKLCRLCIKAGDFDGAVGYYEDYRRLSGNNSTALLLKYEIGRAGGVPVKELIKVLETYNSREQDEKWQYELARLYHEAGDVQKCVETCDNICLWYSEGEYVKKALELKFSHTALTQEQQIRYERMMQDFLDPDEMTQEPEEEIDEVAQMLADEYLAEDKKEAEQAGEERSLDETMVIPIGDIMSELETGEDMAEAEEESEVAEAEDDTTADEPVFVTEEPEADLEEVVPAEEEKPSNRITFEELRAMIHEGNSKKAQSGIFFTYSEPTEEDIAEEEAQKAARAEAKRRAEEEAARKAAEEKAAREAAEAAAREAARLEEEARIEAALRKAEEEAAAVKTAAVEEDEMDVRVQDPDMEIDETRFINRNAVLARLEKEEAGELEEEIADAMQDEQASSEDEIEAHESLGFTGLINKIAEEVDLEEVTAAPPVIDTKEDDETGATQIFSREEIDHALNEQEEESVYKTPEEKLGAAIEQIIDDANLTVERDMEETRSIRIVLPVASASKLGTTSVKLSQYASSVERPELEFAQKGEDGISAAGAPRIIDNVDFSYIPIQADDDGQLGLNIEYLQLGDDYEVEGQMSIDDVMENYSRKLKKNSAKVLDIESERLRQIQEAVNLTAPVKLPYSMDDLMFDDIEMSDINGEALETEGDVFQFDPESIGVIPSDEELIAAAEAEKAAEAEAEETAGEPEEAAEEAEAGAEETEAVEAGEDISDEEQEAESAEPDETEKDSVEHSIEAIAGALAAAAAAETVHVEAAEPVPEAELEEPEEELAEAEIEEPEDEPAEAEIEEPEEAPAEAEIEEPEEESAEAEIEEPEEEPSEAEIEEPEEEAVEAEAEEPAEDTTEAETEEPEEEPAEAEIEEPAEMSEADRAIAEFESMASDANSDEADSAIEDELFDVMAELEQNEAQPTAEDEAAEKYLETAGFDEVFESLMAEDALPVPDGKDADYAEYDNEEILGEFEAGADELAEAFAADTAEAETETDAAYENAAEDEEFVEYEEEIPEEEPVIMSASGYSLPDDIRESMAEFLLIDGMEQQIVDVTSAIIDRKKAGDKPAGNLIVTGDIKSGKTFLAIEMIKAVTEELGSRNGKVAKVQAELLNGKNIEKVFEKIGGSDLIIENIGYLDDSTIEDMTRVISSGRFDSMVIIEGNQLAVESIFSSFPEFAELFENRIDISELSIVQWAEVAMNYADEKGFVLDDMAKLALHARINEINVPTARLGYNEVLDIMDDAIAKAEKRNSGKLFAAFKRSEDEKREIIESDFM